MATEAVDKAGTRTNLNEKSSAAPSISSNEKATSVRDEKERPAIGLYAVDVQLDLGEVKFRTRDNWWKIWYVMCRSFDASWVIYSSFSACRIPSGKPPPPRTSLADAPVCLLAYNLLPAFTHLRLVNSAG